MAVEGMVRVELDDLIIVTMLLISDKGRRCGEGVTLCSTLEPGGEPGILVLGIKGGGVIGSTGLLSLEMLPGLREPPAE